MTSSTRYWLYDAPGINGMGSLSTQRLEAHLASGGALMHEVDTDGFLVKPEAMWPGRGLEGKKVRPDGSVAVQKDDPKAVPYYRQFDKRKI